MRAASRDPGRRGPGWALALVGALLGAAALAGPAPAAAQQADCPSRAAPTPYDGIPPLPVPEPPVGGERLGGCAVVRPGGAAAPPAGLSAASWVVADVDTGEVLAARDPHGRYRPASTIKLLTALVVVDRLPLDQVVVARPEDDAQIGSSVGLVAGARYTVAELLAGLLLRSGNDAAWALAGALGGPATATRAMDAMAAELGALDTRAATPSGLDGPGMSTSAYDLALVARAAADDPVVSQLVGIRAIRFPGPPPGVLTNDNRLLAQYPGALGGKTGYTDGARHTYVGLAERGGRRLVAVLMRAEQQPDPTTEQTAALLDYGFALRAGSPVGVLVDGRRTPGAPNPAEPPAPRSPLPSAPLPSASPFAPADGATVGTAAPRPGTSSHTLLWAGLAVLVPTVLSGALALRTRARQRRTGS